MVRVYYYLAWFLTGFCGYFQIWCKLRQSGVGKTFYKYVHCPSYSITELENSPLDTLHIFSRTLDCFDFLSFKAKSSSTHFRQCFYFIPIPIFIKNLQFFGDFRGYKMGTLVRNGLKVNLTLRVLCILESYIKIKINFKAFIKPFEAPQGSVKIKIKLIFCLRPGSGQEGLNIVFLRYSIFISLLISFPHRKCL